MEHITLKWKKGDAAGYLDVFPVLEFAQEVTGATRAHKVRGPKGGEYTARFSLIVKGNEAILDYGDFASFNEANGILNGVMKLRFNDANRKQIVDVWWDDDLLAPEDIDISTAQPGELTLAEQVGESHKAIAQTVIRPGQGAFRQKLFITYGVKCCLSACAIPFVLEAVHIEPFSSNGPDEARNGLLLRSDLHALFDSNHLAFEPISRLARFSSEARSWDEYAQLDGKQLSEPEPGHTVARPTDKALMSRWQAFEKGRRLTRHS